MKTLISLLAAIGLMFSVACNKEDATDTTASTETVVATDATATTAMDTSLTATSTTTMSGTLQPADQEFVTKAADGGMAEVKLGTLATQKGTAPDVKQFGQMMVTDHGKGNTELQSLAASKGVTLPADISDEHKQKEQKLSGLSGADFDKDYMKGMVEDHQKTVDLFQKASNEATDPDVKAWAAKTLPTLQHHLDEAKKIASKVGAQ
jgi:putative membrane protein